MEDLILKRYEECRIFTIGELGIIQSNPKLFVKAYFFGFIESLNIKNSN